MLSQLTISLLAVTMTVASPLLHHWEHAVEASIPTESGCCDGSHAAAPNETPQPCDDQDNCDCKFRIAVPQVASCDIAELVAKHLPGDCWVATFDALASRAEFSLGLCCDTPVHFLPAADGGDLCARLGRHLL